MSDEIVHDERSDLAFNVEYQNANGNWFIKIKFLTEQEAKDFLEIDNPTLRPARIMQYGSNIGNYP